VKPGVKSIGHRLRRINQNIAWEVKIDGLLYFIIGEGALCSKVGDKPLGVHTAISPGASNQVGTLFENSFEDFFENFLEGVTFSLALPTFVASALKPDD